mgnify:CR=1 FL=1
METNFATTEVCVNSYVSYFQSLRINQAFLLAITCDKYIKVLIELMIQ